MKILYTAFLVRLYFDRDLPTWSKVWIFPLTRSSWYSTYGTFQTVWEHLVYTTTLSIILSKVSRTQKLSITECRVLDKNQGNTTLYRLRTLLATFLKKTQIQCLGFSHDGKFYSHHFKKPINNTVSILKHKHYYIYSTHWLEALIFTLIHKFKQLPYNDFC